MKGQNVDQKVIEAFGREWLRFDQSELPDSDALNLFEKYFSLFPWKDLPVGARGFDLGCGSGRWARFVAPRVEQLYCIDASSLALSVAMNNLRLLKNCEFHCASVENIPLADHSMDFGYSVGVLHHVPDPLSGLHACVKKLKPGAPFLLYVYYAFDNRPIWFRVLWRLSEVGRFILSRAPFYVKSIVCDIIAATVYWPLARAARVAEKTGASVEDFPLSSYRHLSFYVMRTDALDRFGTRLETRFNKRQVFQMMADAGLKDVRINPGPPYWVAVGVKDDPPLKEGVHTG